MNPRVRSISSQGKKYVIYAKCFLLEKSKVHYIMDATPMAAYRKNGNILVNTRICSYAIMVKNRVEVNPWVIEF